jgi:hypothetical protein
MRAATLFGITAAMAVCVLCVQCSRPSPPVAAAPARIACVDGYTIEILANLTDPAKLDSLTSNRAATPRLRKACYWLYTTSDPAKAINLAQKQNGSHGTPRAQETARALLRNPLQRFIRLGFKLVLPFDC